MAEKIRRHKVGLFVGVIATFVTAAASARPAPGIATSPVRVTQVSKGTEWSSGEGWVVADRQNPQLLASVWTAVPLKSPVGAIDTPPGPHPIQCGTAYSTDGGSTWVDGTLPFQTVGLPSNPGGCADPALVVDSDGTLYSLHNGGSVVPGVGTSSPALASIVTLSVSHDHGRTWSAPTKVWSFEDTPTNTVETDSLDVAFDRPLLFIDPATSTLYASISDDALVQRVVLASHDHGATWSTPQPLDPDAQTVWGDVPSAANGVFAVAYSVDPHSKGYTLSPSPAVKCDRVCAVFETSSDDGKTWTRHVLPAPQVESANGVGPEAPGVEVASDPSAKGRYAVLLPVDARSQELWITSDSGVTWRRTLLLSGPGADAVAKPWIAFGPTGALGVVWRNVHADRSYEVFADVSVDGGNRFTPKVELSPGTAPAPPPPQGEPGDDCACNLYLNDTSLYTTWGDARSGNLEVWFARYEFDAGAPAKKPAADAMTAASGSGATGRGLPATGSSLPWMPIGCAAVAAALGARRLRTALRR